MRWVVIGSGPAGVAAAQALADAGRIVTVLDAGDEIEPGQMDVFKTLARTEPDAWPAKCVRSARSAFPVDLKRVPLKPAYGSLFPYALEDADLTVSRENADTLPSLALGGLSNSWGASMAPFRQCDIEDWPITLADLAPHYRAVLRFIPMAAVDDALTEILPLYTDNPGALRRGAQANVLLNHMWRHDAALRHAGFRFGRRDWRSPPHHSVQTVAAIVACACTAVRMDPYTTRRTPCVSSRAKKGSNIEGRCTSIA